MIRQDETKTKSVHNYLPDYLLTTTTVILTNTEKLNEN